MSKKVIMGKGTLRVTLEQGEYSNGLKWYRAVIGKVTFPFENAMALNMVYKQYKDQGYTVIPEKVEKRAAAPKPRKVYPDGFVWDAEQYYRIAGENNWSFCNQYGKIIVPRKYRDRIYQLMAAENEASNM